MLGSRERRRRTWPYQPADRYTRDLLDATPADPPICTACHKPMRFQMFTRDAYWAQCENLRCPNRLT